MADIKYTYGMKGIADGSIDLDTSDIRCMLIKVAASTTIDTEQDAQFISSFTTLGECTATNYARKTLASKVSSADTTNHRGKFTAAAITWTALGGASNDTFEYILYYKNVTNDSDSIPIFAKQLASPQATNGSDVTITPHADGIAYLS